jgi:hypothetical protein
MRLGPDAAHPAVTMLLVLLLSFDDVGLGAVRGYTVRVWRDGQRWLRQGTWTTIALWLAGSAIHVAVDNVTHIGPSNALLLPRRHPRRSDLRTATQAHETCACSAPIAKCDSDVVATPCDLVARAGSPK